MSLAASDFLGFLSLNWQVVLMLAIGCLLIYLGIAKNVEPVLLIPIGIGIILANIPLGGAVGEGGLFSILRKAGIETELFPLL
ncbi:MAG: sodium ion-translocating decarboxylase subunit beta, partial [Dehalococcoidia bacterium]